MFIDVDGKNGIDKKIVDNYITRTYPGFMDIENKNTYNNAVVRDYLEFEKRHQNKCLQFFNHANEKISKKSENGAMWVCSNCGYIHQNVEAPRECPICKVPRSYFGLKY